MKNRNEYYECEKKNKETDFDYEREHFIIGNGNKKVF